MKRMLQRPRPELGRRNRGGRPSRRQSHRAAFETAMSDRKCKAQAGFLKDLRKRAPAARGRPERGESLGADSRLSDHAFFRPVIAEAAQEAGLRFTLSIAHGRLEC